MKKLVAIIAVVIAAVSLAGCSSTPKETVMVTVDAAVVVKNLCMVSYTAEDGTSGVARTLMPIDCYNINIDDVLPFDGTYVTVEK